MMNKNILSSVSPKQIKEIQEQSKKFKADLGYIYRGLSSCDEILNDICFSTPSLALLECSSYIKDFIETLEYYKNIGIF